MYIDTDANILVSISALYCLLSFSGIMKTVVVLIKSLSIDFNFQSFAVSFSESTLMSWKYHINSVCSRIAMQVQLHDKQAFMKFLVLPALISNLNINKSVGRSHVKCKY